MSVRREISVVGIYHIIMRGINHQAVAVDDEDKQVLTDTIAKYALKTGVTVISYTVMTNHVHMQAQGDLKAIADLVRLICISYVRYYFNVKHHREGSLFQSRYKSRAVKDDNDVITLDRYIVLNPQKAGICRFDSYRYSGFRAARLSFTDASPADFPDISIIKSRFVKYENYLNFLADGGTDIELENTRLTDSEIKAYIAAHTDGCRGIAFLLLVQKVSIRRLSRVTGISRRKIKEIVAG